MKTSQEWVGENDGFTILRNDQASLEFVEKIQRNAFKAGMRKAADHVDDPFKTNKVKCGSTSDEIREAILTAAEQLKDV